MSSSSAPESWIASFCSLIGHEYFAEVSEEFIEDDFNLTGLQAQVPLYKEALEVILDVEEEEEEEDEEEDLDEEDEIDESDNISKRYGDRRHHGRLGRDRNAIDASAELLYGLIHQRFICSRAGIQQMSEKYELGHFGTCPRTNCNLARTLPVGLSDMPGASTVKLFCPSCLDVYVPPNSRFQTVDGAFFGRTFGSLFLMTFPDFDLSKHGVDQHSGGSHSLSGLRSHGSSDGLAAVNGMLARNVAPGLGRGKIYEPRVYGFRVSEVSRSGPRMRWLRDKPDDVVTELDEARRFAEENPDTDDDDGEEDEDGDANMNGSRTARNGRQRKANGSPAATGSSTAAAAANETNGAESEL